MPNQTETTVKKEKSEIEENPTPIQKTSTVKQRIDGVIDTNFEDKDELKKQMFKLVQHILYPDQFCPECDERMFFDTAASVYNCANCGYQSQVVTKTNTPTVNPIANPNNPTANNGSAPIPPQVEKAIAEAEAAMKETRIPVKSTPLGNKIRKLVNDRDAGGESAPTKEDEARVKNSSPDVANKINWV